MTEIFFPKKSDRARSSEVSSERMINCWLDIRGPDSKKRFIVYASPGLKRFSQAPQGSRTRGQIEFQGKRYALIGQRLYEVSTGGNLTEKGVVPGGGTVSMAEDSRLMVIVTNSKAYSFDGNAVTQITDEVILEGGVNSVTYLNQRFIFTRPNSRRFIYTEVGGGTTVNPLNFFTAESKGADVVKAHVSHEELLIFTKRGIEFWHNIAGEIPFRRVPGATIDVGCASRDSIVNANNTVFWLGHDGQVYYLDGYTPKNISNEQIIDTIGTFSALNLATAFTFDLDTHKFYVLNHPQGSFVYDIGQGIWHERKSRGLNRWRAETVMQIRNEYIVGDFLNGNLYKLDPDTFDEDGKMLERIMFSPPTDNDGKGFVTHKLFVDFESGVGLTTGQGSNPQVMLQWSDDGGKTWSTEIWRELFPLGQYTGRAVWDTLGWSLQRTYKLTVTDPVKLVYIGNDATIEALSA